MKINIVENNPGMIRIIKDTLASSFGSAVIGSVCESETDAVKQYWASLPDWVIMDIKLTNGNGFDACAEIIANNPEAKIIILTNYDDPEYKHKAKEIGVYDFLLKEDLSSLPGIIESYYLKKSSNHISIRNDRK